MNAAALARTSDAGDGKWERASVPPPLSASDVHVWHMSVAAHARDEARLRALLDAEEQARADRFYFAPDRARYVIAHGLLRTLLAGYTQIPPRALRFGAGEFGKPALHAASAPDVTFNMSHSGDAVVLAVALGRAVGVDVEQWTTDLEPLLLARDFFSPVECAVLGDLPPPARFPAFFACWSRKEAYIKATGYGVSRGLDHFDVEMQGDAGSITDRLAPDASVRWTMRDLGLPPGYSGAVVVEGAGEFRLRRLRY